MAQPTRSDVHVNRPLTSISTAYIQDAKDFVASEMFPVVPVEKQSDRYFTYTKADWFRDEMKIRAPGTESAGSGFNVDNTPSYFCDMWALHKDIDDQTRQNSDEPINLDRDTTKYLSQMAMVRREKQFAGKYLTTGLWTGGISGADFTPSTLWSTAGSDPVDDIEKLKASVKAKTGFTPNRLLLSYDVVQALKSNASILDRIKYTQRGIVTVELLASLFDIEKVLVAAAVQNSAAEGATASMDFMIKNRGLLAYAPSAPSILTPSAGYTFAWKGMYGASAQGGRMKTIRMEHLGADRIEIEMAFDLKQVGADLGVYLSGPIA
jgi:hypothetical protein